MSRRKFMAAAAIGGTGVVVAGCAVNAHNAHAEYDALVQRTWRHTQGDMNSHSAQIHEIVRYATLAPSSHNTQCWKFKLGEDTVSILPDFQRRCPVVDPDDHHLFVSLGCAVENLIQAAAASGFRGEASFNVRGDESVDIALVPAKPFLSPLFDAIPSRQSTRGEFDRNPISSEDLMLLEKAGSRDGVRVHLLTERKAMEHVLDFVIQGNTAQMRNRAFVQELKDWVRFNGAHAARTGDGLFAGSSGNPSVPVWLGKILFDLFFTEGAENDKYARHIRSSAGVAVFVSERDDKSCWVETGRAFERFALQATVLGIRHAHLNQPVEVPSIRPQFANFLGVGSKRPDLIVRFGRGPEMPRSLRRPIEKVIQI
ncbi:MAG: Tat pathway signal protein [Syntrophaceae bacterium]|nr:Tat pathway signal protein [Syntrophaceae bacterium]